MSAAIAISSADNTIGGTTAAARNVISGNPLGDPARGGATGNKILGNYIGTDATGSVALGNLWGIDAAGDASSNTVGGTTSGSRNVISGNEQLGVDLDGSQNQLLGNYIGTDASGTHALANGYAAYYAAVLSTDRATSIGGTTAAARNVISGNAGDGVLIQPNGSGYPGTGTKVLGNYIGTDASGTGVLGNFGNGIAIYGAANTTVGGTSTGARNLISGNAAGVYVSGAAAGNRILGNSIFGNSSALPSEHLGIDLDPVGVFGLPSDGVTANDPGDGDGGPNGLQNFPVVSSAASASGTLTIKGSLNSQASRSYRVELFWNHACDSSGNGEGETLLGAKNVTTNASGNVSFTAVLRQPCRVVRSSPRLRPTTQPETLRNSRSARSSQARRSHRPSRPRSPRRPSPPAARHTTRLRSPAPRLMRAGP